MLWKSFLTLEKVFRKKEGVQSQTKTVKKYKLFIRLESVCLTCCLKEFVLRIKGKIYGDVNKPLKHNKLDFKSARIRLEF